MTAAGHTDDLADGSALARFAEAYADRNKGDYERLREAADSGRAAFEESFA